MAPTYLANTGQLIIRNQHYFELNHLVIVGLPKDDLVSLLLEQGCCYITALTVSFDVYQYLSSFSVLKKDRFSLSYAPRLPTKFYRPVDGVLIFLQKSKSLMDLWLSMTMNLLPDGVPIWLVGENTEGIKSWQKRLNKNFVNVTCIDNARHCVLLRALEPFKKIDAFTFESWFETFSVATDHGSIDIYSLPGVFSHGRLDLGTQILLETFDQLPSGKVLDFGSGTGVISAYINSLPGEHAFTLVDCDVMALTSSDKTMSSLGVKSYTIQPSDGLSEVTGPFDLIVSNPPFHKGIKTNYEVTQKFLEQSCQLLRSGGELRIVANSFLNYPAAIQRIYGICETLLRKKGFSVYRAVK